MPTRRVNGEGQKPFQRPGRRGWYTKVWITDPRTGVSERKTLSAPTKTKLAERIRTLRDEVEHGRMPASNRKITVREYADVWATDHLPARRIVPATRSLYVRTIKNHIVPSVGDLQLSKLRAADVERMDVDLRKKKCGDSTRRLAYNVLKMIFDTAVRDKLVPVNPVTDVDRPTEIVRPQPYYSAKQIAKLQATVEGERILEYLVPLLAWTAMRIGEALALRWSDLDLDAEAPCLWVRGTLTLDEHDRLYRQPYTKGKDPRPLPLMPAAVKALKAQRKVQAEEQLRAGEAWVAMDLVFATELGGMIDPRNLRRRYTPLVKRAGLTGSFHSLRRSTATMLTAAGAPLNVVATILGHSSTTVTQQRYAVVNTETMTQAMVELESYWKEAVGR